MKKYIGIGLVLAIAAMFSISIAFAQQRQSVADSTPLGAPQTMEEAIASLPLDITPFPVAEERQAARELNRLLATPEELEQDEQLAVVVDPETLIKQRKAEYAMGVETLEKIAPSIAGILAKDAKERTVADNYALNWVEGFEEGLETLRIQNQRQSDKEASQAKQ